MACPVRISGRFCPASVAGIPIRLHPQHRGLGPVRHAELAEDVLHDLLHRPPGDAEALGDLAVRQPDRRERQNLALPRRQAANRRVRVGLRLPGRSQQVVLRELRHVGRLPT